MIKALSAILFLVGVQFSVAFDYNITSTEGLFLVDVKSGIRGLLTLFKNEFVTVSVIGIQWGEKDTIANSTDSILYKTYVDGILQAEGSFDLAGVGRELPTSVEVGNVSVSTSGTHTINVVLSVDEDPIETENHYQAFAAAASLIPLLVVLLLALYTHQVELSLGCSVGVGACMVAGSVIGGFKESLSVYILEAVSSIEHGYVYLFTLFLSGTVAMMEKSGGMHGFTKEVSRFAKSPRTGQFAAFCCGLMIFFDDYASALLVGQSMSPLLDLVYTSREKLAFICDATAAPIASITPVSSWVGFEVGLIQTEIDRIVLLEGTTDLSIGDSGLGVFLQSIKYRYYPIFMLFLLAATIVLQRDFGPLLIAERRTQVYKRTDGGDGRGPGGSIGSDHNAPHEGTPQKWWNMLFPISILVFLILWILVQSGDDGTGQLSFIQKLQQADSYSSLLWGTMGAALIAYLFYMIQFKKDGELVLPYPSVVWDYLQSFFRGSAYYEDHEEPAIPLMTVYEAVHSFLIGMARIFPALIVLTLAWASGSIMTAVGTDRLFSSWIVDSGLPYQFLPSLSFIISFFMALATGTSWGTMSVVFPLLLVPTWIASNGDALIFYSTTAGVLSGSVAGDHISPISDTTVLSALASDCSLFQHVVTQTPYAVYIIIISVLIGTLPVGYDVWPNPIGILIGIVLCFAFVFLVCKPVISKTGQFDIFVEIYIRRQGADSELNDLRTDTIAAWEHAYNEGPPVVARKGETEYLAGKELSDSDDLEDGVVREEGPPAMDDDDEDIPPDSKLDVSDEADESVLDIYLEDIQDVPSLLSSTK